MMFRRANRRPTGVRKRKPRAQRFEQLEQRLMLDAQWQNPARPADVNNDGIAVPLDALLVLNRVRDVGVGSLPQRTNPLDRYYDVSGDGRLAPQDALLILNEIGRGVPKGHYISGRVEGESEVAPAGFISMPLTSLPGQSGELVELSTSITIGSREFNEMGFFVVDTEDGMIGNLSPSSPGYADAVFASGHRHVLYSRRDILRDSQNITLPANSHVHVYVLQAFSEDGDPSKHIRVREREAGSMRIGWEEQAVVSPWPMVGDRYFDDVIVNVQVGTPYGGTTGPVLNFIPNQTVAELTELQVQAIAVDAELPNDALTYSLDVAPSGVSINPLTGLLTWTPTEAQGPGTYTITIRVTDQAGNFGTRLFQVTVLEVNLPPVLEPIPNRSVRPNDLVTVSAVAADPDIPANRLMFSLDVGAPSGATIDPNSGQFQWTAPDVTTSTAFPITIRATDDGSPRLSATQSFTITVNPLVDCAFDDQLTGWTALESGGSSTGRGTVVAGNCTATLTEGDSFVVGLQRTFIVPATPSAIQFTIDDPTFDATDTNFVNDAFEVAFVDQDGNSLVQNFEAGRDAFLNMTEGLSKQSRTGIVIDGNVVTVGLNGLPPGTVGNLIFRLVNNDSDTLSKATIHDVKMIESDLAAGLPQSLEVSTQPSRISSGVSNQSSARMVPSGPVAIVAGTVLNPPELIDPTPFAARVERIIDTFDVRPERADVMMTPMVGDLNRDGVPDIVFTTSSSTVWRSDSLLRAVSGDDGRLLWTVTDPQYELIGDAEIAIGDIDNDGFLEIVASHESGKFIAFEHDGTFKWITSIAGAGSNGGAAIADLDHDGSPEIVFGNVVLNADGSLRWKKTNGAGNQTSAVADLDMDGSPEIVAGSTAYRADGSIYWQSGADGFVAIGNLDDDVFPEIVSTGNNSTIRMTNHDGTPVWGPLVIPGGGRFRLGGAPTIADFDNDGAPEIGVANATSYVVFESDGTVKWTSPIQDTSSGVTGSSVFDFDGDGRAEVVFGDELNLRILDGETGNVLYQLPKSNCTSFEYPVVVDADGDGQTEIVASANRICGLGPQKGIYIIGSENDDWVPTRSIWNQHTYHITNINDDGTIPRYEANSWEVYNNYRRNLQPTGTQVGVPLLTVSSPNSTFRAGETVLLFGKATSQGTRSNGELNSISQVTVNGQAVQVLDASGEFFNQVEVLSGHNTFVFTATDALGQSTSATLELTGLDTLTQLDFARYSDTTGSFSGQYFRTSFNEADKLLHVDLATRNDGQFVSDVPLLVGVKNISDPSVQLVDFDGFMPDGTPYYDYSDFVDNGRLLPGQLTESPTVLFHNPNRVQFDYELVFLGKLNEAPRFTSVPRIETLAGRTYTYDVDAIDPDDDPLAYSLLAAPAGMTINATSGVITWKPTAANRGQQDVTIEVSDGRGGTATQDFVLTVGDLPPNRPPVFVTEPVVSVEFGAHYTYNSNAIDADDDTLRYSIIAGPSGMLIDESSGELIWHPTIATQVAYEAVDLSHVANYSLNQLSHQSSEFPTKSFTVNDVPFFVPEVGENIWHSEFAGGSNPRVSELNLSSYGVTDVYVLINSYWGAVGPTSYAAAEFVGDNGAFYRKSLIGDVDIRDFIQNKYTNNINNTTTVPAFVGISDLTDTNREVRLDMVRFTLPESFADETLETIRFVDTGGNELQRIFVSGVTLATSRKIGPGDNVNVAIAVEDGRGGIAEQEFVVCVHGDPTNHSPSIVSVPNTTTTVGAAYTYKVEAVDPDEHPLTYKLERGPDGMNVDPQTGLVTWNVTEPSNNFVVVSVTDGLGGIDEQQFTIDVADGAGEVRGRVYETTRVLIAQSTFDTDLDGWTSASQPQISWESNGGNPNGNLHYQVVTGVHPLVDAPPKFLGDWTELENSGALEYDFTILSDGGRGGRKFFVPYEVFIGGPGGAAVWRGETPTTLHPWKTITVPIEESLWTISSGSWNEILKDVQRVQIRAEVVANFDGGLDSSALDNIRLVMLKNGLEGRVVYVDQNQNGIRDIGELNSTTDSDGNYALPGLPAVTHFVRQVVSSGWQQTAPVDGKYSINLATAQVVDGIDFANSQLENVDNRPPVFDSGLPGGVSVSSLLKYTVRAVDPDNDSVLYNLLNAPTGMTIHPTLGILVWIPTESQLGTHTVVVRASDSRGGVALQSFDLTVSLPNANPSITSTPPSSANISLPLQYQVRVLDAESDPIQFSLESTISGMTIDPATGLLRWTPQANQTGMHNVTVVVVDGKGGIDRQNFKLNVSATASNQAPEFTSIPRTRAFAGHPYGYELAASDANGDPITFTLTNNPSGMTLDANGRLSWTPTFDQVATGPHTVRIEASDGRAGKTTQTFDVTVGVELVNDPPAIVSNPPLVAVRGREYVYDAKASDPDADPLTWTLKSGPSGMSIDPVRGLLRWEPREDQLGEQTIIIEVHDIALQSDTQRFVIDVRCANTAPAIVSVPPTSAVATRTYLYAVRAEDLERDTLRFDLPTKPTGMSIDPATGVIRWSPTTTQIGLHDVVITSTDSFGALGRQKFSVKVSSPSDRVDPNDPTSPPIGNRAPIITSTPNFTAEVDTAYEYSVIAVDPDGDALTYTVTPQLPGMTISPTGRIQWTPTAAQVGQHALSVTVKDANNAIATQGFLLSVAVNQPPEIRSQPVTSVIAGATYRYSVLARDPENGPLTYRLEQAPAGMTIDANGRILWQTLAGTTSGQDVKVVVQDNRGQIAEQSFKITVNQDTEEPLVGLAIIINDEIYDGGVSIDLGNEFAVRIFASDNVEVRELGLMVNGVRKALDTTGATTFVASSLGDVQLEAFALDSSGLKGEFRSFVRVVDPARTNEPTPTTPGLPPKPPADPTDNKSPRVVITSPEPASSVTNRTPIIGTVDDLEDNLWYYRVYYARADRVSIAQIDLKDSDWVLLNESTEEVIDGELAVFDPAILSNDPYAVIVAAFDSNGRGFVQPTMLYVEGNVQVGNFRLEFTDLSIPLAGIPIQISRIYDTLNAADEGDFGFGWSLGVQSGRILEVAAVGAGGALNGGNDKLIPDKSKIYITNPSGQRVGFTYKEQLLSASFFGGIWRPYFQADPGVYDTLTIDETQVARGGLVGNLAQGINPSFYTLTTKDGLQYRYSDTTGLQSVREPNGNALTFTRDGVKHSSGEEIKYIRDHRGRIVSIVDPDGNSLRYQYNAAGDLESFTNQVGLKTSYQYLTTPAHYLDQAFDSQGKRVLKAVYELNPETRQTEFKGVDDAAGNQVQRQDFDTKNNTGIVRDGNGNITTITYDDRGNVLEETDPVGTKTIRRYEDARNPDLETTIIDRNGIVTNRDYDARGNLLKITERGSTGQPLNPPLITEFAYDTGNNVTSIKNAVGNQTLFAYDAKGNLSKITNAIGDTSTFTYDTSGRRETFTDFNGNKSIFIYEGGCPCGAPDKVINADGSYQKFFYNFFGQVLGEQHFEANGTLVEQKFTNYDNSGRITIEYDGETIGGKWNSVRKFYDAAGNLDWEIVVDPRSTTNTGIRDGLFNFLVADLNGSKEQLIAAGQSRITDYDYDANNRLVKQTDAEGGIVQFRYDTQGNRVLLQDPVGNITTWVYDTLNRVAEERDPLYWVDYVAANASEFAGKTGDAFLDQVVVSNRKQSGASLTGNQGAPHVRSFGYDAEGNQTEIIDRNNRRREFSYDHAGRLLEERWYAANNGPLVETISFTYDILGNMLTAQNANSKYTYTYDRLNRLKSVDNLDANPDTPHVILFYEYDAQGNVIKTSDDAGVTVQSTYSQRNQLETRKWFDAIVPSGGTKDVDDARVDFSYTASGRQKQIRRYSDLTATTKVGHTDYTYDLAGRTDKLIHKDAVDALLSSYDYGYDFSGLLVDEKRDHQDNQYDDAITYGYDLTGQLVDAAFNAQNDEQFVYDANGNRISSVNGTEVRTYTTGPANQLTSDSVYRYEYDGEGNLKIKIRISDGQVTEHFWDHHNRLVKVEERSAGGIILQTVEFANDVIGRLINERINGALTFTMVHNHDDVWTEFNAIANETSHYLYTNKTDHILSVHRTREGTLWFSTDKLGSIRHISTNANEAIQTINYSTFGKTTEVNGRPNPFAPLFTGRELILSTGLQYNRARLLDLDLGRFATNDPIVFLGGDLNLYRYVNNSPTNGTDPTGQINILSEALVLVRNVSITVSVRAGGYIASVPYLCVGLALYYPNRRAISPTINIILVSLGLPPISRGDSNAVVLGLLGLCVAGGANVNLPNPGI